MPRAVTLDDLYRLREASDPQVSPDHSRVVFVVTAADREGDKNTSSIWSVETSGGEPRPLTRGPSDLAPRFSPDGRYLAFIRRQGDAPQVWILPTDGGEARKLTNITLGASGIAWAPDSSRLAVPGVVDIEGEPADDEDKARRTHAPVVIRTVGFKADGAGLIKSLRTHLFVVDVTDGQTTQLTKDDLAVSGPAWSPRSDRIAFAASTEDRDVTGRTRLYVVGADGGDPDEVALWEGTAAAPTFSPEGDEILFVGQDRVRPGHARLFTVPSTGGAPEALAPDFDRNVMTGAPAYPGAQPCYTSDGSVLFCARDRGCTHAYVCRSGDVTKLVGTDDRVISGLRRSGDVIAFIVSAPDIPSDVFAASIDGSDERRLTHLNEELIGELDLHTANPRTFTAPDSLEIHGWLIEGDGDGPRPLLVDVHGGPHNAWSPVFDASHLYHEVLASMGWSILRLNPRGSDGYGESFMTAVVEGWGISDEHDFLSAVDALIDEGIADAERLAISGYSYGGYMTNWLTARTDRFRAAVSGGCVSNLASEYGSSDLGFWMGVHEFGGDLHEVRERYAEMSPLSYVEGVKTPTLILHGENDDRCPVGQAEEWFVALRRRGVEVELVRYPQGSHLFILNGRPSHRVDYNQRIVDWLTRHCG